MNRSTISINNRPEPMQENEAFRELCALARANAPTMVSKQEKLQARFILPRKTE